MLFYKKIKFNSFSRRQLKPHWIVHSSHQLKDYWLCYLRTVRIPRLFKIESGSRPYLLYVSKGNVFGKQLGYSGLPSSFDKISLQPPSPLIFYLFHHCPQNLFVPFWDFYTTLKPTKKKVIFSIILMKNSYIRPPSSPISPLVLFVCNLIIKVSLY